MPQSFSQFGSQLGGLLSDPEQMNALGANPLFNVGMGLMSSRYDKNINPYSAAMQGLGNARQGTVADEKARRAEEQRKQLAALIARMQQGGAPAPAPPATGQPGNNAAPSDALDAYYREQHWRKVIAGGQ